MADALELEHELAITKEELTGLPADAFNERITLRDRIIDLEAAVAAATPVPRDGLRRELADLTAKRLEMVETRINASNANGGLGSAGGIDPNFLHAANRKIDALTGIGEVEARIREIKRLLAEQ